MPAAKASIILYITQSGQSIRQLVYIDETFVNKPCSYAPFVFTGYARNVILCTIFIQIITCNLSCQEFKVTYS